MDGPCLDLSYITLDLFKKMLRLKINLKLNRCLYYFKLAKYVLQICQLH